MLELEVFIRCVLDEAKLAASYRTIVKISTVVPWCMNCSVLVGVPSTSTVGRKSNQTLLAL